MTEVFSRDVSATWNDLTPRQQDIMLCLAQGYSNQEIADNLSIKLSTVRNNLAEVYMELGLSNRVQALRWVLSFDDLVPDVLYAD